VICLITPVEDAAQMSRVQRHEIFCTMHYDRIARGKRGEIKKMVVIVWPGIFIARCGSRLLLGIVNSIEVTHSFWSKELSRPSHCLRSQNSLSFIALFKN